MAAQCRPHSYGRTCCCTRGHTSPVNGKRHTFHRCHPRKHITTRTPTRPQRQHITPPHRQNFRTRTRQKPEDTPTRSDIGHHITPLRNGTDCRTLATLQLPPGKRSTVTATATYFHVSRPTRPQRPPRPDTATFHGRYGHNVNGPHCRPHGQKKSPHTGFSPVGAISLFSYKFHDFLCGFSVRGLYKLGF